MLKNKYNYMEIVRKELKNRGKYEDSKKVINFPFDNRFVETWHGMFRYSTNNPAKGDCMLGNFYLECDELDFNTNRNIMITAVDYLHNKYGIPYNYFYFFMTNRSLWCYIPYKVFGLKPQRNLNEIYRKMASEINEFILKNGYSNGLDLSIYKWNGLIHALGSYLPKIKKWVNKFEYGDLLDANVRNDLYKAKWDYGFTFSDVDSIEKCIKWANKVKYDITKKKKNIHSVIAGYKLQSNERKYKMFIEKIKEVGLIKGNRNNTVYTYALLLKRLDKSLEEAYEEINLWLKDMDKDFYYNESSTTSRTIESAYRECAGFSFERASELLGIEKMEVIEGKNTFIIPRSFIDLLNENKCHWKCYKFILEILYHNQILDCNYEYDLSNEKYKKNVVAYFEKLKKIGLICYTIKDNKIIVDLTEQEHKIYRNYCIIPARFIEGKKFKKMNSEIKVFCEILRSSIVNKNDVHYSNIKISTICENISATTVFVMKAISKLMKNRMICYKYITFGYKHLVEEITNIIKKAKDRMKSASIRVFHFSFKNHKMIYSIKNRIDETIDIAMLFKDDGKNIYGD